MKKKKKKKKKKSPQTVKAFKWITVVSGDRKEERTLRGANGLTQRGELYRGNQGPSWGDSCCKRFVNEKERETPTRGVGQVRFLMNGRGGAIKFKLSTKRGRLTLKGKKKNRVKETEYPTTFSSSDRGPGGTFGAEKERKNPARKTSPPPPPSCAGEKGLPTPKRKGLTLLSWILNLHGKKWGGCQKKTSKFFKEGKFINWGKGTCYNLR